MILCKLAMPNRADQKKEADEKKIRAEIDLRKEAKFYVKDILKSLSETQTYRLE